MLPQLAAQAINDVCTGGNPREVTVEDLIKIYEGSSKGFVDLNSFTTCINHKDHTFFTIYPNLNN